MQPDGFNRGDFSANASIIHAIRTSTCSLRLWQLHFYATSNAIAVCGISYKYFPLASFRQHRGRTILLSFLHVAPRFRHALIPMRVCSAQNAFPCAKQSDPLFLQFFEAMLGAAAVLTFTTPERISVRVENILRTISFNKGTHRSSARSNLITMHHNGSHPADLNDVYRLVSKSRDYVFGHFGLRQCVWNTIGLARIYWLAPETSRVIAYPH